MDRRQLLKAVGTGSTFALTTGRTGATDDVAGIDARQDGRPTCPVPPCINDVLGYTGLSSDQRLPAPLQPDHEVQLLIRPREGGEIPEFFFEPTGLFVEPGDVVQFTFVTPDHTVSAYHPAQGRQQRVPEGVAPMTSPLLTGGTFWLYRFDEPGVYDLFCAPHEVFGMVMRLVVDEPTMDFGEPGPTARPPELTAGLVLQDPALAPDTIVSDGPVSWDDLSPRSKQVLVEFNRPLSPEPVVEFEAPNLPENVAFDVAGNAYLSLAVTGEILKVAPDGTQSSVATLDLGPSDEDELQFLTGIDVTADGIVFAALASFDEETHGLWRVDPSQDPEREVAMATDTLPNDVVVRGEDLFVSESFTGSVWRVRDGDAEQWLQHDLLEPSEEGELPIGANGLAFAPDGSLYVANTNFGRVVHVPVSFGGDPGDPSIAFEEEELVGADGIAVDVLGRLYVAVNQQNAVVRASEAAGIETLLTAADGLDFPSDVHFGTTAERHETVFVTNYAVLAFLQDPATAKPSLLSFNVDEPGLPPCY